MRTKGQEASENRFGKLQLAQRLQGNKRFEWRDGMAVVRPGMGHRYRLVGGVWYEERSLAPPERTAVPPFGVLDLDDPATKGCLFLMLADLADTLHATVGSLGCDISYATETASDYYMAPSLVEAVARLLLNAWESADTEEVGR